MGAHYIESYTIQIDMSDVHVVSRLYNRPNRPSTVKFEIGKYIAGEDFGQIRTQSFQAKQFMVFGQYVQNVLNY